MSFINVSSEFAPLKSVVLAQSQFCVPSEVEKCETNFLNADVANLLKKNLGLDFNKIDPIKQLDWEKEKIALKELLESYGVTVYRPRLLTDYEKQSGKKSGNGYSNFFARDPFFTIGNFLIEGNFKFAHRRKEVLPVRPIIEDLAVNKEVRYLAMPQVDISNGESSLKGPFLEGGDVLVLNKQIFVGYSGLASNLAGIKWLSQFLGHFDYEVIPVRLHPNILHLDCAMSLLRNGLMIVCEDAFLDGVPKELSNWEKIHVTMNDATNLMTNGLPINENVYITDIAFTNLIKQIEQKGIKVETIDYSTSRMLGGAFRCTTQALVREY